MRHCIRSAETFSEQDIVSSTQRQLTWTHLKSLMYIKDPLERQFYAHLCGMEHWDTRTLDQKIDQQLYQRSAISRKPEEVIKQELAEVKENNQLLPDLVFRSSYFLDMLGLPDVFTEKDLESAIITQIEGFIKEDMRPGLKTALSGGTSDARNATIMKMFGLLDFGERAGSGIPDLFDICNTELGTQPDYDVTYAPARTTLTIDTSKMARTKRTIKADDKAVMDDNDKADDKRTISGR